MSMIACLLMARRLNLTALSPSEEQAVRALEDLRAGILLFVNDNVIV